MMELWKWRLALIIFGLVSCIQQTEGSQRTKQQPKSKTKENVVGATRPRDAKATECVNQVKANEEESASFFRKEIPETEAGKCLLACYLEGKGLIVGGKISSSGAARLAARAYPNNRVKTGNVKHILSHCGTIAGRESNNCEMAYKLADCTTTLSDKFKL
uniref:Odorant-binding protein 9 n=1 Tax=Adelphocoris suturalis TaxID=323751 RepID=A0A166IGI7_9HEMI|nr:odorant-binding protein 9 [Adelphocoris suturalis]